MRVDDPMLSPVCAYMMGEIHLEQGHPQAAEPALRYAISRATLNFASQPRRHWLNHLQTKAMSPTRSNCTSLQLSLQRRMSRGRRYFH